MTAAVLTTVMAVAAGPDDVVGLPHPAPSEVRPAQPTAAPLALAPSGADLGAAAAAAVARAREARESSQSESSAPRRDEPEPSAERRASTSVAAAPEPTPTAAPTPRPQPAPRPRVTQTAPPLQACPTVLAGTRPHVAQVGHHLARRFDLSLGSILGVGDRPRSGSLHPSGRALDFMVGRATGDRIADYALANMRQLGITEVIWRQRYNNGSGWDPMPDRGGATANHMDHVHLGFDDTAGPGLSC